MRLALLALLLLSGCATLAPTAPRFVLVFEQRSETCRIQVLKDVRSNVCLIGVRCSRQPMTVVLAPSDTCVP